MKLRNGWTPSDWWYKDRWLDIVEGGELRSFSEAACAHANGQKLFGGISKGMVEIGREIMGSLERLCGLD